MSLKSVNFILDKNKPFVCNYNLLNLDFYLFNLVYIVFIVKTQFE